jgi:hypothetical protein
VFVKFPNGEIKRVDVSLYVPNIKQNLLSIWCISNRGYIVEFIKSIRIIRNMQTCTIVGKGHRLEKRGLYKLQACIVESNCWNLQCGTIVERRKASTLAQEIWTHQLLNSLWIIWRTYLVSTKVGEAWPCMWHMPNWEVGNDENFEKHNNHNIATSIGS